MQAMQDLKPEMDRVRQIQKDNRSNKKRLCSTGGRKVNPLVDPSLVQMPIFITMFYVIGFGVEHPDFIEGRDLWFQSLTQPDRYYILLLSASYSLLPR